MKFGTGKFSFPCPETVYRSGESSLEEAERNDVRESMIVVNSRVAEYFLRMLRETGKEMSVRMEYCRER